MARGITSAINQAAREAQREERKRQVQAIRAEQAAEKNRAATIKSNYIRGRETDAQKQNDKLNASYAAIDGILAATLHVDDYFELTDLYRTPIHPSFRCPRFETPTPKPEPIPRPSGPIYRKPSFWMVLFGKKRYAAAVSRSMAAHVDAQAQWKLSLETIESQQVELQQSHELTERKRLAALEQAKVDYEKECDERVKEATEYNLSIDELITNLAYGSAEAVEMYITLVFAKSNYPTSFPVSHTATFNPTTAELNLRVSIQAPRKMSSIKAYRYVKKNDEVVHSQLSQKAQKDRYASAVHQVALRSIHEVFEADRRGFIKTVSIEVGTITTAPATGVMGFIPLAAVAAERESFMAFDLSAVVPQSTLSHLGASLSKNPFGLVPAKTTGVRLV